MGGDIILASQVACFMQAEYWRQFLSADAVQVEYGNDVEGTGFASSNSTDPLAQTQWNLQARDKRISL